MTAPNNLTRRIVVPRRGGPDVLQIASEASPEPGPHEVRVAVEAAGVSAYDVMLRGHRFPGFSRLPYTPGEDITGLVDKLGNAVTDLTIGQRVGGWTFGDAGGYAEHLCRPAADLAPVPDGLDPAVAVAMIVNNLTADLALHQAAQVASGESLLVQGAGGGLGSAILQLARLDGIEAFGADAAVKHDQIRADGATPIDYEKEAVVARLRDLSGGGVDTVIDLIGGPAQLLRSYRSLRPGGRMMMLGMAGTDRFGTGIILPSLLLTAILPIWPDGRRIAMGPGMETYPRENPDWYRKTLRRFFELANDGHLTPRIADRVPLVEAARAHAILEHGRISGKLTLVTDVYKQIE